MIRLIFSVLYKNIREPDKLFNIRVLWQENIFEKDGIIEIINPLFYHKWISLKAPKQTGVITTVI